MIQSNISRRIFDLATIGATLDGGVTRRAFSEEDIAARDRVISYMEESGLKVRIDEDTNIIGYKEGSTDLPAIVTGSHIDTVPNGGKYDGALGVIAGIEAIANIPEPRHTLEVVVFTDEESTMCGSKGMTKNREDDIAAFLELHVEQGPVLEAEQKEIGIVTGIVGQRRFSVSLYGVANHAGTTPMDLRDDALLKASELALYVREQALEFGSGLVATVGKFEVSPNAANVVPDRVDLTVECRDLSLEALVDFEVVLRAKVLELGGTIELQYKSVPVLSDECVNWAITRAANKFSDDVMELPSRASHDAQELGRRWPMGMIFIPSVDGVSHNPKEYSTAKNCLIGTSVLQETIEILDELLV